MSDYLSVDEAYERDTTDSEITLPDGRTSKIKVKDATLAEIEAFEDREDEDEDEDADNIELVQEVFDEYVVEPSGLDASQIPMPKVESIMAGVFKAWGVDESDLDDFIENRQGN